MRLLVDANLSPQLVSPLRQSDHDVVHVADIDKLAASDTEILQIAETEQRVVITADTDFPMMLALRRASSPSVVLLRGVSELTPDDHAGLIVSNLSSVAAALEAGAIVTITPSRVRVRDLPIDG
jgi:predicted nuclease of predicted toxin-antitoxin system